MRDQDIIRRPLITEKATTFGESNIFAFEVAPGANKIQVKRAVETQFKRRVAEVRIVKNPLTRPTITPSPNAPRIPTSIGKP